MLMFFIGLIIGLIIGTICTKVLLPFQSPKVGGITKALGGITKAE